MRRDIAGKSWNPFQLLPHGIVCKRPLPRLFATFGPHEAKHRNIIMNYEFWIMNSEVAPAWHSLQATSAPLIRNFRPTRGKASQHNYELWIISYLYDVRVLRTDIFWWKCFRFYPYWEIWKISQCVRRATHSSLGIGIGISAARIVPAPHIRYGCGVLFIYAWAFQSLSIGKRIGSTLFS